MSMALAVLIDTPVAHVREDPVPVINFDTMLEDHEHDCMAAKITYA